MALEYLKHFYRHTRPIEAFRLLILDNHDSHAIFRFKKLAYKYKIILLITELEATTLNTNEATTTRSGRTRRAPVRFRNS